MDYFDRQKRIEGWVQEDWTNSTGVCFGVGGLGSVVAINLCRLGIGKLIMFDYDLVEAHNLNRQLLFGTQDIGIPKVEAAKKNLAFHNLGTVIEGYNLDVVENWGSVLQKIVGASVIFNMMDYGDYFDASAQSLALSIGVPLVQGGTYAASANIEFFYQKPCFVCASDSLDSEVCERITPDKIQTLDSLSFLPKNNNPVGLSNCYLCGLCGMLMCSKYGEWLLNKNKQEPSKISNRTIIYSNTIESFNFDLEINPACKFCGT